MEKFGLLATSTFVSHNREFIYGPRGFNSVYEMNEEIIRRWNEVVDIDEDVYVLGDIMLNDNDLGGKCVKQLKGRIHIVLGNHDTEARVDLYKTFYNVVEVKDVIRGFKYNGYHFYLSHYPTLTGNLEKESLKQMTLNIYGHTHQKENFYEDRPYMYHVGVDSHNCYPVSIDQIIADMNYKAKECKEKR